MVDKSKVNEMEEERHFFTSVLTILTIGLSLLLTVETFLGQEIIALNGSAPPTANQITLTQALMHSTAYRFGLILAVLFISSFVRFVASSNIIKSKNKKIFLRAVSFTLLILAIIVAIYYASIWVG